MPDNTGKINHRAEKILLHHRYHNYHQAGTEFIKPKVAQNGNDIWDI